MVRARLASAWWRWEACEHAGEVASYEVRRSVIRLIRRHIQHLRRVNPDVCVFLDVMLGSTMGRTIECSY